MLFLFDIDGTLIGGGGAGRRAFDRACLEVLGVDGALDGLKLDGMTDPLILEHVFTTHLGRAPREGEGEAVLARYLVHLGPEVARAPYRIFPGVERALDRVAALPGSGVGLCTGNLAEGARLKLERGDLWRRFAFGGFGSDARQRADVVRVAIARGEAHLGTRVPKEKVWVIGDTPRDVDAAHAAGVPAVGVATGSFSVDELREAGADLAYPTLDDWLAATSCWPA
jgi:phosphoglycolate phosphatase-like HAD superfamily hydrolase